MPIVLGSFWTITVVALKKCVHGHRKTRDYLLTPPFSKMKGHMVTVIF